MTSCRWAAGADPDFGSSSATAIPRSIDPRLTPVDERLRGPALSATVRVRMASPDLCGGFEEWLTGQFDIVEVFRCAGPFDYELRLSCGDPTRLTAIIGAIRDAGGAEKTETTLLLNRVESSHRTD